LSLIVDASVAFKWVVDEEYYLNALALLEDTHQLEAPNFILAEIANIAWKKCRRRELSDELAQTAIQVIPRFIATLHPSQDLYQDALSLSLTLDHPAYDCFYLACAEKYNGTVVTADQRFLAAVKQSNFAGRIIFLADIPPLPA
jgi:predicted nucleic acid-binding protein